MAVFGGPVDGSTAMLHRYSSFAPVLRVGHAGTRNHASALTSSCILTTSGLAPSTARRRRRASSDPIEAAACSAFLSVASRDRPHRAPAATRARAQSTTALESYRVLLPHTPRGVNPLADSTLTAASTSTDSWLR